MPEEAADELRAALAELKVGQDKLVERQGKPAEDVHRLEAALGRLLEEVAGLRADVERRNRSCRGARHHDRGRATRLPRRAGRPRGRCR
jgi:hypothetical protein